MMKRMEKVDVTVKDRLQRANNIDVAVSNFLHASILDSVGQSSIQVSVVCESNILRNNNAVSLSTSFDISGHAIGHNRNVGVLVIVVVVAGGLAAGQHASSHNASQHQRGNLLEFHSEFFLLMVYKR